MRTHLTESEPFVAFMLLLAVGWVALAHNSDNVPWNPTSVDIWWVLCGLCAGSALAVARYRSMFALRTYAILSASIGAFRSLAYISNNSGGPAAVWYIYAVTVWGGYLLVREQHWKGKT